MSRTETTDLLCRARRGDLSSEERRRLDELVQTSPEARLLGTMLAEFDRESQVRSGDDLLLARLTTRALETQSRPVARDRPWSRSRPRARLALALIAAALFLGSAAFAWRLRVSSRSRSESKPVAAPTEPPPATHRTPALEHAPSEAASSREVAEPGSLQPVGVAELAPAEERTLSSVPGGRARAAEAGPLFAQANMLRREGRNAEAMQIYGRIIARFPHSREASPSRLALAKLLRADKPERALEQFRVLAREGGSLRPEALWGIVESAKDTGQSAVAAQALADLQREFPSSPYAEAARNQVPHAPR